MERKQQETVRGERMKRHIAFDYLQLRGEKSIIA